MNSYFTDSKNLMIHEQTSKTEYHFMIIVMYDINLHIHLIDIDMTQLRTVAFSLSIVGIYIILLCRPILYIRWRLILRISGILGSYGSLLHTATTYQSPSPLQRGKFEFRLILFVHVRIAEIRF